jgi:endogenous inhibitor of DNA gyrase (YacG/DUF329 family)
MSNACPICAKPASTDFRPFCSKRCADVDLHRWLSGSYVIPGLEEEPAAEDADGDE